MYHADEVDPSLAFLQEGLEEGAGPLHMTPTRGSGEGGTRQAAVSEGEEDAAHKPTPGTGQSDLHLFTSDRCIAPYSNAKW